ncbi:MAG: hypothetical protein JNG90_20050, partial [Planctomycetaceae bacterium]|nr:hypothetical protein [Planctomycetaceae bacterium]
LMNIVTVLALGQCALGDARLTSAKLFVGLAGPISVGVAIAVLAKSIRRQSAEQEFAAWFRLPRGCELAYHEGWWVVHSDDSGRIDEVGKLLPATCQQSS